jgi:hypothetical protein
MASTAIPFQVTGMADGGIPVGDDIGMGGASHCTCKCAGQQQAARNPGVATQIASARFGLGIHG